MTHLVDDIREAWRARMEQIGTHYETCYRGHATCAISILLEVIDDLQERLALAERVNLQEVNVPICKACLDVRWRSFSTQTGWCDPCPECNPEGMWQR